MYGYGYRYNSGLVVGSGGGGAPFANTYSLDFDGVDDKVEIGTQSLGITGAISVSAWVKIPTTNIGGASPFIQVIFGEETRYNPNRNWALFWRGGTNLNGFSAFIYDSSGVYTPVNSATPTPNDNQWHHLMFTYTGDTTTNGLKLFVDGVQIAQSTSANGGLRASSTVIPTIGGVSNSTQRMFEGSIDEASIFDSVIPIGDVWDGSGAATDLSLLATPPLSWYRMGDNGSYKSPQWLIPNNENKDKVSNYSFELDGVNDYINLGDSDDFSFGNGVTDSAFSVSVWFKLNGFGTNNVVFSKDSGLPNREYAMGFFGASKKLRFYIKDQGGNNQQSIDSTTLFAVDTWYNVVCTYDGSGGSNAADGLSIYVNSVKETPTNIIKGTYVAMSNTTAPVNIGQYGAAGSFLRGKVDEVSVYNTELLQADITDVYNGGEPTTISGAFAHYKMGENATLLTDWTIPDEVGTNDGTSVNMNVFDRVGEAPNSTSNSVSLNMDEVDRVTDVPT